MKRKPRNTEVDIFIDEVSNILEEGDDNDFVADYNFDDSDNVEGIFEEGDTESDNIDDPDEDKLLSYKDYAMKKSNTKKVSSQNYDAADLYSARQDIVVPSDCIESDSYFNEDLEQCACEIIKGTTLEKYNDGRHIPIKDVVTCFVKLADKWPDELVYCFTLIAYYGKVLRYKSLLDAIPTSYRDRMIGQLSRTGAEMIKSMYKGEVTVVDIFC